MITSFLLRYLIWGIIAFPPLSIAQKTIQIKTLTTEDGLNFRHVNAVEQDNNGFMWFGTTQGIAKYDGNTFKVFNSSKNNPNFIPYEEVIKFQYQSSTHTLWYIANHKLFALDLNTENLKTVNGIKDALKGEILDIAFDHNDNLWIVRDYPKADNTKTQHLVKYDGKVFHSIKSLERKSAGLTSIEVTKTNQICWATVNHGFTLFSQEGEVLEQKIIETYDYYNHTIHYAGCFFDSKNQQYYFSEIKGGVDVYKNFDFSYRLINHKSIFHHAVEDKNGGIWFTGKKELFYTNASGDVFDYTQDIKENTNSSNITSAFVDQSNLLWLGTDNGLIKVKQETKSFENILHNKNQNWGLSFRSIFGLKNADVVAMCETENQLYKLSTKGEKQPILLSKEFERLKDARYFVSDTFNNLAYTVTNALIEIDFNSNDFKLYNEFRPYLNETKPNPIISLDDGSLIMGYTLSRLIQVNPKTKAYSPIFKSKFEKDYLIQVLFQSKTDPNFIWVGTKSNGLLKVNLSGKIEAHYHIKSKPSLNKNLVLSLLELNDQLLIGTFGGGINRLDLNTNSIQVINTQDGLCNNNVVSILPESDNVVFAATYNGLSRINLENGDIQNYYEKDGISDNEFNYTSAYKSKNGQFYFGGLNGITKFSIDNLPQKKVLPALNFTKLEMFNQRKDTLIQLTRLKDNPVVLSPYDINLRVNWSIPDYFNKENYTYYTKMEGFESKWFFQGHSNSIRYNQLPAGEYNLKIKGIDINGNETKAGLSIPIIVNPIFYKTWWFISLAILCVIVVIYIIFHYRLNQALALERLRTKISSDLHDDVGSMLTGLAMQTEMLEMQTQNQSEKSKLKKITVLSRQTISHMRDLVWSIDGRRDRISDLIERMHELAEEMLLPAKITYDIEVNDLNFNKKINLNCKRNLFLIYKEAINNIIRHSNANYVKVTISLQKGTCLFSIKDNGDIKNLQHNSGMGLTNMKMRSKEINADLNFDTRNGFGITVLIPNSII